MHLGASRPQLLQFNGANRKRRKRDGLPRPDSQIDSGEGRVVSVFVNETSYFEYMFHLLPPSAPIMRTDRCER